MPRVTPTLWLHNSSRRQCHALCPSLPVCPAERGRAIVHKKQTTHKLTAPLNNPDSQELSEIEITDPTHPLFGRRFPVIARPNFPLRPDLVVVAYRPSMFLRIPVPATSLITSPPVARTKLTPAAVSEVVALTTQCEVLCLSTPTISGGNSRPHSKRRSAKISAPSSRR